MWSRNRQFRKYIIIMLIVMAVITAAFNILTCRAMKKLSNEYCSVIAALIHNAKEQYPDFNDEEWIAILNSGEISKGNTGMLERYGIYPDDMPALSQNRYRNYILASGNIVILLLCVGILALIWRYQSKRTMKIEELTEYIRQIEQGIYALEPCDNKEDELSVLKNELYKITIMLKETARHSNDSKRALADSVSDISHQLKTPLTSCLVLLDNLSENKDMDEITRHKFLSEITRQITNINWLIVTLLKLSRMDAGVVEFSKDAIEVDKMLEEVFEALAILAELKQIQFQKKGSCNAVIYGDAHWIKEAVMNLVKNAVEHSPANESVIVSVEDNLVYTALSVIDFGEGIPANEQKHIFERFYKSSGAREDSFGIGLSLCKEIVERQNGYITVSSEPGRQTEFRVKFIKS